MIKKISLSVISVIFIIAVLETGTRFYEEKKLENFPPVPDQIENFGNFENLLKYYKDYGYIQDYYARPKGTANDFVPYAGMLSKPNMEIKIKNINYATNSLRFRGQEELIMPKPEGIFRIFILGGSTVFGGFNDNWIISRYLEEKLNFDMDFPGIDEFEVVNAGVLGHSSINELILIETKILDLAPDLVVVFDGFNDIQYASSPTWEPGEARDYLEEKNNLDLLVNYPSVSQLMGNVSKLSVKKSRFLTNSFRFFFRRGTVDVYPRGVEIDERIFADYVANIRMAKAVLDSEKVRGLLVFQPNLSYCKESLTSYEQTIIDYYEEKEKTDWFHKAGEIWPRMALTVSSIPDSDLVKIHDASCLFKDIKETAYVDSVHYVPSSYKIIGEYLAETIQADFFLNRDSRQ